MNQKKLSAWLKAITVLVGLCIVFLYAYVVPVIAFNLLSTAGEEYAHCFVPWLVFVELTAVPIFIAIVMFYLVCRKIGENKTFSHYNARLIKHISLLAAIDACYFFVGNIVFMLLYMSHPGVALISLPIVLLGFAVSVIAASLSHLVVKAADMQEESDLTI